MILELTRIIVIGVLAYSLYYILTKKGLFASSPSAEGFEGSVVQQGYEQSEGFADLDEGFAKQIDTKVAPAPAPSSPKAVTDNPVSSVSSPKGSDMSVIKHNTNVVPYPQISNNYNPSNVSAMPSGSQPVVDCYPKDIVKPDELLPKDDPYSTWNTVNPSVSGHLADKNFLESAQHFGINTVGSSLRNANLQLRSDPAIPMVQVGPWQQSTISADTNRRQFELGGDY